jgi:hypothetical protein
MHLSLLLLRLLKHLLDNLLLLDQECANDTVLDTSGASRSTVGSLDSLLWAGDVGVFAWSEGWDTLELGTAVTACDSKISHCPLLGPILIARCTFWSSSLLLDVEISELSSWGLDYADEVGGGVV